jgi:CD109 antigen
MIKRLSIFLSLVLMIGAVMACGKDNPITNLFPDPLGPENAPPTSVPAPKVTPVPGLAPDSFVAIVPRTLRTGYSEHVSVSLFNADRPVSGNVRLTLFDEGRSVGTVSAKVEGTTNVTLPVPQLEKGQYEIDVLVEGVGESRKASVQVEDGVLLFVETDKPIYKPGHTVHMRLMTLDAMLKPWPSAATIEVQDAKGIKVFKKEVATDDYGMVTVDLPLSTEPNLGVWKVTALAGDQKTQLDVRVEEYVLPKYEVTIDTERSWALANEPIKGTVSGEYSFGKPVVGEVEIVASRYVGQWEEYARFSGPIDGETTFDLPPVGFVAGVPEAGGQGNVTLDVTIHERGTGYEEKTSRLFTVAATSVTLKVIPDSNVFKPGLDMTYLVVAQTPDGSPVDTNVTLVLNYMSKEFDNVDTKTISVVTSNGRALVKATPPSDAVAMTLEANAGQAHTSLTLQSGHSPSGNFIHLEQITEGDIAVGDTVRFHVNSTREASNFYYEVLSRGTVIFTDVSPSPDIEFVATQLMAPSSRILVYQILPNNEIAADYLPFSVEAAYPHDVQVSFGSEEVRPGDSVDINIQTQGESRVGLVAVDKSVFILAENRLNLQQVFNELEKLYLDPQVELHEARFLDTITTRGAYETFEDAGTIVLTNKDVPSGEKFEQPRPQFALAAMEDGAVLAPQAGAVRRDTAANAIASAPGNLAEVQRVRQFFPETWIWQDIHTDENGNAVIPVEAPDSITTWMLRAVAMSKEHGLGIGESQLRVFQPFFLTVDLPFSAIRGEEFPVKIALFNYLETPQEIFIEIEGAEWFDLLDEPLKSITIDANDIGGADFMIRPKGLGSNPVKITARSTEAADAVIKELLVEPEGVQEEIVENHVISDGHNHELHTDLPFDTIDGSGRAYVALTGSFLTQTIEGLDQLLKMPFGCGEQNMILFAPNVYIARYLMETDQLKPEIMAKAEHLMLVGYQRELTYRRSDGSFSAFGDSDEEGSLWLTAFVLKTFVEAKQFMYIDQSVIDDAAAWIEGHQLSDGSFENVGFLHHQELLGGLQGRDALTAYVAVALQEAGRDRAASSAIRYLEGQLGEMNDSYTMAITSYAMELADSPVKNDAYDELMSMAKVDDNGALYWGEDRQPVEPYPEDGGRPVAPMMRPDPHGNQSAAIETTGYALLALLEHQDLVSASRTTKWIVGQRNALGGFGSTQDTVVSLQGLTSFSTKVKTNVDMTVVLESDSWRKEVRITPENADVLQMVQVPLGSVITVTAVGKGDIVLQSVLRYNMPERRTEIEDVFNITVDYGTDHVEVDDLITVSASVRFTPPSPIEAGMVVLDVAVPTGFEPVRETITALVEENSNLKRFEIAGRKVILYIEDMMPGESVSFEFQARAKYPVRAKEVVSQVYSYYRPEYRGEIMGGEMTVTE